MGEMYVVILWINFEKALDLLKMIQVHVYCYNISVPLSVKHSFFLSFMYFSVLVWETNKIWKKKIEREGIF